MSSVTIFLNLLVAVVNILNAISGTANVSPQIQAQAQQMLQLAAQMTAEEVNATDPAQNPPTATASVTDTIASSAPVSPDCVPNPVLTVSTSTEAVGGELAVVATYTTGCSLDPKTSWKYSDEAANEISTLGMWSTAPGIYSSHLDSDKWTLNMEVLPRNMPLVLSIGSTTASINP